MTRIDPTIGPIHRFHRFWKRLQDKLYPVVKPPMIAPEIGPPKEFPVKEKTFPAEPPITQEVRNWCLWYAGMLDRHASEYAKLALELEDNPGIRTDLTGDSRLLAIAEIRGQANQCESTAMDLNYRTDPDQNQYA